MRHLLRAFVVIASCVYPSFADACACISSGPPCQNFFRSEAVFVGTVTGIRPLEAQAAEKPVRDGHVVAFQVEQAVRGIQGPTVDVRTGEGGGDCGFSFKLGERYVVYAYRHRDGSLGTGICSRTRLVAQAAEDLAYFAAVPATGAGARMSGTVTHWEHDPAKRTVIQHGPVADVQVRLRGPRGTYSALTGSDGQYDIDRIPVGTYEVEVLPPPAFSARATHRKVEFTDPRACRVEDISLRYDGRIIGTLLDVSGRPAPGVRLDLVAAEHPDKLPSFNVPTPVTDGSGRYELVEVPPGRYLLAVGLTLRTDAETSYPTTFYPGTPALERARPIEVGPGARVQLDPLRLPDPLARHTLNGTVVKADGSPMNGATVVLTGPRGVQASGAIRTDDQGRFSVPVFEGLTYTVRAFYNVPDDPKQRRQVQASEAVRIAGPPAPLRLVLSPR